MTAFRRNRPYDCSLDPDFGRDRRESAAWLGLWLIFLNIFAVIGPALPAGAESMPFQQEFRADRIVICTAGGLVVMDLDGHPIQNESSDIHGGFCVFCVPLMHGVIDGPTQNVEVAPTILADVPHPVVDVGRLVLPVRLPGSSSPRAPPFV